MKRRTGLMAAAILLASAGSGAYAGVLADATSDALGGIEIGGYIDISYLYNFNDPSDNQGGNGIRIFDNDHNDINLNLLQLYIDRLPEDPGEVGFRIDFAIGEDSSTIVPDDLFDMGDDFNIYQAYISYIAPIGEGLTIDLGRWVTHHGYEVIESPANDQFSRSILFGWAIPFTHMGLRMSYDFNEMWGVSGAITQGWDVVEDNNDSKTFHGAVYFRPTDTISITNSFAFGPELDDNNHDNRFLYDLVASWQATEQLLVGANFDYGFDEDQAPDGDDGVWWGVAGYVRYDITDALYVGARGEYFDDSDGQRISMVTGQDAAGDDITVSEVKLWEVTLTLGYNVLENLLTRIEYRHDDADKAIFDDDGDIEDTQDTIAFEVVYSF